LQSIAIEILIFLVFLHIFTGSLSKKGEKPTKTAIKANKMQDCEHSVTF
jgi:hypothetical protein